MRIDAEVKGESKVTARIERFVPRMRSALRQRMSRIVLRLQAHVVQDKLQGQVLNVREGRLQRSINQAVIEGEASIMGIVGSGGNVKYAAAHEYGFQGAVTVREHLRTITQAFGKPLATPVTATVRQHTMNMNLPERSFLRSALSDERSQIISDIRATVGEQTR